jgi:hypothetical protein
VVERDGVAYNTLDFTDAYATSYGDTRVPAAGLTMDETSITATTDVAQFESRDDQRFTNRSRGSIHAARIRFTGPTAGNDSAYTVLQPTKGGPGRGGIVMRTALDLSQASGISLQASAHDPRSRPVHATVLLRRSFGGSVRVGTVTLNGHCAWTDLSLPDAARDFRDTLVLQIPAKAVRAAGGRVRLDLFDVRASA